MIYLKSLLAGVGALIAYYFLFVTIGIKLLLPMPPDLPDGAGYVSNSPWVPLWLILVIALLVFAAVYFWTFRKLSESKPAAELTPATTCLEKGKFRDANSLCGEPSALLGSLYGKYYVRNFTVLHC